MPATSQSVAVRLLCEREKEIRAFAAGEYWTIDAFLEAGKPPSFKATLARIDSRKAGIKNGEEAQAILQDLAGLPSR